MIPHETQVPIKIIVACKRVLEARQLRGLYP